MKRVLITFLCMLLILAGCSAAPSPEPEKAVTEQDVRNAVTELINGINNGDAEVVEKYVGAAGPVAEQLIEKMKNNVRLSNIRDISIQGTSARATVTLEVVPLKVNKDITLNFDITDVLLLDNPLGLLTILL